MAIPKRSYWLRKVVSEEGMSYHISFRDGQGKIQELCVSYDFFMAFRRLELDERKLENWDYRHKEFSDIMEETLNWRALRLPKSIEERILEEERTEFLHRAINTLPEIQRRRFLLYYECDYKCYEIGAMEQCQKKGKRADEEISERIALKAYPCIFGYEGICFVFFNGNLQT